MTLFFMDKLRGVNPLRVLLSEGRRVFRGRWLRVVFLVFLFMAGSASTFMWAQSDSRQQGLVAASFVFQAFNLPCSIVAVPKELPLLINDTQVWANGSMALGQDLVVQSGGVLYLVNYTLSMNCTSFNEYGIRVEGGGAFYVQDVDFNSSTGGDASVIRAVDGGYSYTFRVERGAVFQMVNSELHHCGYVPGHVPLQVGEGVRIEADYTLIQGCKITTNAHGLLLSNCDYNVVIDNYIAENFWDGVRLSYSNHNEVMGNTLDANSQATTGSGYSNVMLDHSSNNWIVGNDVTNSYNWFSEGITVGGSSNNNTVEDNFVYNNQWCGIGVRGSRYNVIHNNVVFKTRWWGVEVWASDNTFTENIVNEGWRGFVVRGESSRNNFTNNTASKNEIGFMLYGENGNEFYNVFLRNIAEQNTWSGFLVQGYFINIPPYGYWASFNLFENNTARNNTNGFTVMINCESNNFTGNLVEGNDVGFELSSAKNNRFTSNTVVGNDYGYRVLGGSNNDQFINETLEDNQYHVYLNESVNAAFSSSTLKDCLVRDLFLNNSSELNLFNTSFASLTIDATSTLNIKNYLRVRVVDSFGNPLPGMDVEVVSFGGGFQKVEYATGGYGGSGPRTDGGGYTPWILVTNATYPGSVTPVLRNARVYVKGGMVNFPDVPVTVGLVEPQTVVISGVLVLLPFPVMLGLMSAGGSSAPLYAGVVCVSLVALVGVAVYFLRFRK